MSESSEIPKKPDTPRTFFGINHTDDEIKGFVNSHVHKSERRDGRGLLSKLFGGKISTTEIEFDNKGISKAIRAPQGIMHEPFESSIPEGRFVTDWKGHTHRVGDLPPKK